jgi:hypothetical protein
MLLASRILVRQIVKVDMVNCQEPSTHRSITFRLLPFDRGSSFARCMWIGGNTVPLTEPSLRLRKNLTTDAGLTTVLQVALPPFSVDFTTTPFFIDITTILRGLCHRSSWNSTTNHHSPQTLPCFLVRTLPPCFADCFYTIEYYGPTNICLPASIINDVL